MRQEKDKNERLGLDEISHKFARDRGALLHRAYMEFRDQAVTYPTSDEVLTALLLTLPSMAKGLAGASNPELAKPSTLQVDEGKLVLKPPGQEPIPAQSSTARA